MSRFAYADPPYLGMASRYAEQHPDALLWNDPETHRDLIERLSRDYDGWALSLHVPSLRTILAMCPDDVVVMAWCKSWASWKPGVYPARAWEPVIIRGAAKRRWKNGDAQTPRDWCVTPAAMTGFFGAKPEPMVHWLLACLGVGPDDDFDDLFPGSGAVTRAWERWRSQMQLGLGA